MHYHWTFIWFLVLHYKHWCECHCRKILMLLQAVFMCLSAYLFSLSISPYHIALPLLGMQVKDFMTLTLICQGMNLLQVSQDTIYFHLITYHLEKKECTSFEPLLSCLLSLAVWFELSSFSSCMKQTWLCIDAFCEERLEKMAYITLLYRVLCQYHLLSLFMSPAHTLFYASHIHTHFLMASWYLRI